MESEQRMQMVEDIRRELAKGCYQMDGDHLPYTGKAQIMADKLWELGYRPETALIPELEAMHDAVEMEMVKEDDYQHGYLHGMRAAIDHVRERLGKK